MTTQQAHLAHLHRTQERLGDRAPQEQSLQCVCLRVVSSGDCDTGASDFRSPLPQTLSPFPGAPHCSAPHTYFLPTDRSLAPRPVSPGPFPRAPTWARENPPRTPFIPQGLQQKGEGAGLGL